MKIQLTDLEGVTVAELLMDDSPGRKEEKMKWALVFMKAAFEARSQLNQ